MEATSLDEVISIDEIQEFLHEVTKRKISIRPESRSYNKMTFNCSLEDCDKLIEGFPGTIIDIPGKKFTYPEEEIIVRPYDLRDALFDSLTKGKNPLPIIDSSRVIDYSSSRKIKSRVNGVLRRKIETELREIEPGGGPGIRLSEFRSDGNIVNQVYGASYNSCIIAANIVDGSQIHSKVIGYFIPKNQELYINDHARVIRTLQSEGRHVVTFGTFGRGDMSIKPDVHTIKLK